MSVITVLEVTVEATCQVRQYEPVRFSVSATVSVTPGSSPEQIVSDTAIRLRGMLAQQFRELEQPAASRTAEMLETSE